MSVTSSIIDDLSREPPIAAIGSNWQLFTDQVMGVASPKGLWSATQSPDGPPSACAAMSASRTMVALFRSSSTSRLMVG
jgi:hypothetical protein